MVGVRGTREPATSGFQMVGVTGFEPATSASRTLRATKLRHTPLIASATGSETTG